MKPRSGENEFLASMVEEVIADCYQVQTHNTDHLRFPEPEGGAWLKAKTSIKERVIHFAAAHGFIYVRGARPDDIARRLTKLLAAQDGFGEFYNLLQDESSRRQVIKLLAFSVLGKDRVKLPQNTEDFWNAVERIDRELLKTANTFPVASNNWTLDLYDLDSLSKPIQLHAHKLNILDTFLLEQYRYEKNGVRVATDPGDAVIDAGGCWGDSALYFADLAGDAGRVYSFEFTPANLVLFEENLRLNPALRERIMVVPKAVWDRTGESLPYSDQGPGTSIGSGTGSDSSIAETISIDDFVAEQAVDKVDFIKMDIEGAELRALRGAESTIRKFRPKLAIALYHHWDDFITIPRYIDGLNLGYEFYLDHFTIHQEETVLFAHPA